MRTNVRIAGLLVFLVAQNLFAATSTSPNPRGVRGEGWEAAAMNALLANAEAVLEAKRMVESGRPTFGDVTHRTVSESPRNDRDPTYPITVEEFVFPIFANYGDAIQAKGTLTILQTTIRYPRAPQIEYSAKVEPSVAGTIIH